MRDDDNATTQRVGGADPKTNRNRVASGKKPLLSYHVLTVNGLSSSPASRATTSSASSGISNRLHLCRGHFKRYTEDKPLFGRYTGLYWWQPHIRGADRSGAVIKDYDSLSPRVLKKTL